MSAPLARALRLEGPIGEAWSRLPGLSLGLPLGAERFPGEHQQPQDPERQEKTGGGGLCLHTFITGQKEQLGFWWSQGAELQSLTQWLFL